MGSAVHRLATACPACGASCRGARLAPTGRDGPFADWPDHPPESGDLWFCVACCAVAILDEGLRLRLPSPAEAADLAQDAFVQEYLAGLRAFLPQSCPGGRDTEDGRGLEPP